MISFWRIFWLETLSLVRSKTLAMLSLASAAWMFAAPHILTGDGTPEGAREVLVRYSLGGVFALLLVSLLASATGTLARERTARRLQLTLVRPVRYAAIAFGKILAHVAAGAAVLALAAAILAFGVDLATPCHHVRSPILPSVREEAKEMYASYMADTNTPVAVRFARKSAVLRLLENRAIDHFQTIPTNGVATWSFQTEGADAGLFVRMRFTNTFEMRQDVRGMFRFGPFAAAVSNITQAVVTLPLARTATNALETVGTLAFANRGASALMLRPRRDLNLLVRADGFGWNLLRAYLEMVAVLALVIAFGTFLSAGLGRPVALFTAMVALAVSEMSPSVIAQYPDELETKAVDRIGLMLTRVAADLTHPVSTLAPLEALSKDECVEPAEVTRVLLLDLVLVPLLLAFLSGLVLPRKEDDRD